jgi:hypothetical protein
MYLFANEIIIPERLKVGVRISPVYKQVKFVALWSQKQKKATVLQRFCSQVSPPDSGEGYSEELFRLSFTLSCLLDNLSRCDLI